MLIIVLLILVFVGFAALIHAAKRADIGFENESGFFTGAETTKAPMEAASKITTEIAPREKRAPVGEVALKKGQLASRPRKTAKKGARQDSMAAFQLELGASFPQFIGQDISAPEKR